MKLNLALNIMMGSLITKSVVYGQKKALQTRSLETMEEVVGAGCRNSINFYGHTKTKGGSKCVKSTLCEASHTNAMFIPQARDTCVQFSADEPECSLFEVVTSFEEGWSLQHLTMKPSNMDASLDPKSVRFLASKDKLVWKELLSSEVAFQNREDRIAFTLKNKEIYHHYALQFETSKDTMYVGKVGLVESYTASCAADLHHKITGVSIPYYETMAPTSVPTKKPFQGHQFDNKDDLVKAVDLWFNNNNSALNQYGKIDDWDVSLITNMNGLFYNRQAFNEDLSRWNVAAVTYMAFMFQNTNVFNADLSGWNVAAVTAMHNMFWNAHVFNADLSGWDVGSAISMSWMFRDTKAFNANLSGWDVRSVTTMNSMFKNAYVFNADLSGWNVAAVTDMSSVFYTAEAFNVDLSGWDVSSAITMASMFRNAKQFSQVLCWKISSEANISAMFHGSSGRLDLDPNC